MLVVGEHAREALTRLLAEAGASAEGIPADELCTRLQDARLDIDIAGVIAELRTRKMLVDPADEPPYPERPEHILAWNVGTSPRTVAANLSRASIAILGVNTVSRRLAAALAAVGASVQVVDHPELRNVRLFTADEQLALGAWDAPFPVSFDEWQPAEAPDTVTCLVACSDFGGSELLADWNEFAYEKGWHFLPVVLQNLVGLVGPLVVPGETACYQCLLARENANLAASSITRAIELVAFQGQSIAAHHPSMASALADVAALELTKHYGYGWPSAAIGKTIEVNLMAATMQTRPILKAPGCPVCSSLNARGAVRIGRQRADAESDEPVE
jgi:molybdopterin-synthase adenylyltransferase